MNHRLSFRIRLSNSRRLATDKRGVAVVEFGLIVIPLIAIILAVVQMCVTLFIQQTLETATEKAARLIMTGQNREANTSRANFKTLVCSKLPSLVPCSDVMVDVAAYSTVSAVDTATPTITYQNGTPNNSWSYDPGEDGEIVRLRVLYLAPSAYGPLNFTLANQPNGKRLMLATMIFKNETTS